MGPDGVLVETDAPTGNGYPLGSNGDTDFVQISPRGTGYDNGVGASTAGGPWAYADWSNSRATADSGSRWGWA